LSLEIKVPSLGTALSEVKVKRIFKKEGEPIKKGEAIIEVESNKANFEICSSTNGIINKITVKENEKVNVGDVVATVNATLEQNSWEPKYEKNTEAIKTKDYNYTVVHDDIKDNKTRIFPAARKLIEKYNLDPSTIRGTGIRKAITKKDVLNKVTENEQMLQSDQQYREEHIEFSNIRSMIAKHLVNSLQTAAHVTTLYELDMTETLELKDKIKEELEQNFTTLPMLIRAFCKGIEKYPKINSSIRNNQIVIKHYVNVGVAIDTEKGLVVPVLFEAQNTNIIELNKQLNHLIHSARNNNLTPAQMENGTITISNAGSFGAIASTPIIHQPQSVLLWIGKIQKKPVVINNNIVIRDMVNLCISYDHRVLDGAEISRFVKVVEQKINNPVSLLI